MSQGPREGVISESILFQSDVLNIALTDSYLYHGENALKLADIRGASLIAPRIDLPRQRPKRWLFGALAVLALAAGAALYCPWVVAQLRRFEQVSQQLLPHKAAAAAGLAILAILLFYLATVLPRKRRVFVVLLKQYRTRYPIAFEQALDAKKFVDGLSRAKARDRRFVQPYLPPSR